MMKIESTSTVTNARFSTVDLTLEDIFAYLKSTGKIDYLTEDNITAQVNGFDVKGKNTPSGDPIHVEIRVYDQSTFIHEPIVVGHGASL